MTLRMVLVLFAEGTVLPVWYWWMSCFACMVLALSLPSQFSPRVMGAFTPFRLRFVILGGAVMRPARLNAPYLPFVIRIQRRSSTW